jgi:hypothetical protein
MRDTGIVIALVAAESAIRLGKSYGLKRPFELGKGDSKEKEAR